MGKFIGPGYVRVGPVTAGVFGVGCLMAVLRWALAVLVLVLVLA